MGKSKNKKPAARHRKPKLIYRFGKKTDGDGAQAALLGGKGANLAEMARIGLPVPPGFTLTTEVYNLYHENGRTLPDDLYRDVRDAVGDLEAQTGRRFGDPDNPLLLSVRSGARSSMPGMMDTILNLGLNDKTVEGLARETEDPRFARDCYRRFIQMYGDVVMGVRPNDDHSEDPFDEILGKARTRAGVETDAELEAEELAGLIEGYKTLIKRITGLPFPQDVWEQLRESIGSVFASWESERAVVYRRKYSIPREWGTAVNVQAMVFGNRGSRSGTGVAFTRNPATGEKSLYGEYLLNAQGEDVVAGIRTPKAIAELAQDMPEAHRQLEKLARKLERHFRDLQDFEFTIEDDRLHMLQTRNGKRTGLAAVKVATDMVKERLINSTTALKRIPADSISTLLTPVFSRDGGRTVKVIATGLPAGPGAASGRIVFSSREAERLGRKGEKVILCRHETSPEDIHGMLAAEGILTARGGVSSHAALVARQLGKVCVAGASRINIDYAKREMRADDVRLKEGDTISIDGTTGEVFAGELDTEPAEVIQVIHGKGDPAASGPYQAFNRVMRWSDRERRLGVRANADTPEQAREAVALGAEGIGLCRTEHMFFHEKRLEYVREMILAPSAGVRERALKRLAKFQRADFVELLRVLNDLPLTVRLLDPPLHEFLPDHDNPDGALASRLGLSNQALAQRLRELHEQNPMLGHRGCRLGITFPEITEMQARALFEAVVTVRKEFGIKPKAEVMIPLVGFPGELQHQAEIVRRIATEIGKQAGLKIDCPIGTMIEIPRAAIAAEELARDAAFFSFGTNDLTQTTLGMSRDDSATFLAPYEKLDIIAGNPFATLDTIGVGFLVEMAVKRGRKGRPDLKLGICGEHGGDPDSICFFHRIGLDYVSCAPHRVPVARLAAAQAALDGSSAARD